MHLSGELNAVESQTIFGYQGWYFVCHSNSEYVREKRMQGGDI